MKLEIKLDPACTEPLVTVQTDKMTQEVERIVRRLTQQTPTLLTGSRGGVLEILEPEMVYRIYASGGKANTSCVSAFTSWKSAWTGVALSVFPMRRLSI